MKEDPLVNSDRYQRADRTVAKQLDRVTPEQWTELFSLSKAATDTAPGHWAGGTKVDENKLGRDVIQFPYFVRSKPLEELMRFLHEIQLIVPFDWNRWIGGRTLEEIPLDTDVDAIKMLTSITRKDRFCEGQLAVCVIDGTFTRIFGVLEKQHHAGVNRSE